MTDEERVLAIIDLDAIAYNMTNIKSKVGKET